MILITQPEEICKRGKRINAEGIKESVASESTIRYHMP